LLLVSADGILPAMETASPPVALTGDALTRLERIARAAGDEILGYYTDGISAELKSDQTPVTAADHAAHRSILRALAEWNKDVPVISEEGTIPSYAVRSGWGRFWLVDPLDGTKEFLQRNGEFTVNIALIEGGEPVLGVVYAPAQELMYVAGRGLGSWKRERAGDMRRITSRPLPPGTPLVVAESRSHPSAELHAYLATIPVKARVQAGSSLKFCWVAEGKADIYPRFGRTMEWDVAAGDCVFRESGADAPRRSPLRYNKPDLANAHFIIGNA
jgi:3'(2'), 5'-bisphosphate nucleotidase